MMRALLIALLSAAPLLTGAVDLEVWLGKREMLSREAERLREAYRTYSARVTEPAEDLTAPLETHPDGSVKLMISAKRAQMFLKEDIIWAEGVVIRKFDDEGREVSRIEAERCVFDRNPTAKSGWADGPAKVTHKGSTFTGKNIYFSSPEGYVISYRNSKIVSRDMKMGGVL